MPAFSSLRKVLASLRGPVTVVDVSARDGLQAEPRSLDPPVRAAWVRSLLEAGVPETEAGSFVSPAVVPQMAGTAQVLAELRDSIERIWVLVPNRRGLEDAARAGARNIVCVVSATETHSAANLGRPIARVLKDLEAIAEGADGAGLRKRLAVSMAWVDPSEGDVPREQVLTICARAKDMGFPEITLCDTYGGASPQAVAALLEEVFRLYPASAIGLHLHDTFGGASACTLVGLCLGLRRFDAAIAGLGGCPFVPGARGNMATEHLIHLLSSLGLHTGIDETSLHRAARQCLRWLGRSDTEERSICQSP